MRPGLRLGPRHGFQDRASDAAHGLSPDSVDEAILRAQRAGFVRDTPSPHLEPPSGPGQPATGTAIESAVVAPKLYGLRQSAATNAADDGVSSRAIADAMGHADVATTEQYDRRTFESVQEAALAQVAGAIRQERGGGAWRLECRWNAERPSEDRGSADGSRDELPGMQGRENGRRGQIWTGDP